MELRQAPEVDKRLQAVRAAAERVPGFMPQRSTELATSALVQRLETAVLEASPGNRSCAIINRSPLTEARQQRFPRVAVQVRLRCGNPGLATVRKRSDNRRGGKECGRTCKLRGCPYHKKKTKP